MVRKALILVGLGIGSGLCVQGVAADTAGQAPQNAQAVQVVEVVSPWVLGVSGQNWQTGFQVSRTVPGSSATSLWIGNVRYTLQPGDRIAKVNGVQLNCAYTLKRALARSNGVVSLTVWDARHGRYVCFRDVQLDPAP